MYNTKNTTILVIFVNAYVCKWYNLECMHAIIICKNNTVFAKSDFWSKTRQPAPVSPSIIPVNHLLYADDLVVFAPSISGLRELLKVCDVFADSHDIKYNPNKSQVLISRGKFLSGVNIPPFCIGGSCIPETDTVKYLGHFICNTMRDDTDILRQRRQLYARANVLARKFYMCTDEVKVLLFRTFCCNLYTCQLWWNFTQTAMRKINVAYNNAFRMIMQLPRYCSASNMFAMCNVPSCQAVMRN